MRWLRASQRSSSIVPAATCECQPALGSDGFAAQDVIRGPGPREPGFELDQRKNSGCDHRARAGDRCGTALAEGASVQPNCSARSLLGDSRGAVTVEYLIVFSFVGLTTAAGIAAAAPALVRHYSAQRAMFYQSYP